MLTYKQTRALWSALVVAVVLGVGIVILGCDDGPDLIETSTSKLVNPGMVQCTAQSAQPTAGWVRLYAGPEGFDFYTNCMMVQPNQQFPNLHNGGPNQWYYSSGWWVWDNVGSIHFLVPSGKCVAVSIHDGINYGGNTHVRKHCQPPGQGEWSVFIAQIPATYGIGLSSLKTKYCEWNEAQVCTP